MNLSSRITQDIDKACLVLQQGGIVGIPTETVYGLAAVALNAEAVSRVFQAKGRPTSHPLIVHLSPHDDINRWGVLNESAQALANALWPGPLTLLVPRTRLVPRTSYSSRSSHTPCPRLGHRRTRDRRITNSRT